MATLIVLAPPAAGTRLTIQKNRHAVIGRDPTCDLVVGKQSISRFHAQVLMTQGVFYLEDMKSTNGTFLNGRKVKQRVQLKDGDRISMHDVPLVFLMADDVPMDMESTIRATIVDGTPLTGTVAELPAISHHAVQHSLKGRLKTLIEITQDLGSTLEIEEILPKILDLLFRMFPAAMIGEIHLLGPNKTLEPVAMKHGREADSTDLTGTPFNLDLIKQAFTSRQGMIRNDNLAEAGYALDEFHQSLMCAPILAVNSDPWGVILLETDDSSYCFQEDDLELLSAVAVLAGQAIGYSHAHAIMVRHNMTVRQMETARQIQLGMLPRSRPVVPGYKFSHHYSAAEKVGGDYFFYEMLRDGRVILGIADASGKGLPAAMNISRFAGEVRLRIATSPTLKAALARLNEFVLEGAAEECIFITSCLCVLDSQLHAATIANAGHLPPLLKKAVTGEVLELVGNKRSFPLGISPTFELHPWNVKLEPGDQVILFTDGVTEAMNPLNELYGSERLYDVIRQTSGDIEQLVSGIVKSVNLFRESRNASDDMTIVGFERRAAVSSSTANG